MYYPKFLLKTNLYTNGGEFTLSGESYIGYYYETPDGKYYTQKSPDFKPNFKLEKINQLPESDNISYVNRVPEYYLNNPDQIPSPNPKSYYPILTDEDYDKGIFVRYFTKPYTDHNYKEIDNLTYTQLITKSPKVNHTRYTTIFMNWILTGEEKDVAYQNKSIILSTETNTDFKYLGRFLNNNYLQFYK